MCDFTVSPFLYVDFPAFTAARFGVPLEVSEEEKKAARAAKFGVPVASAAKTNNNNNNKNNKKNDKNAQKGEKRKSEPIAKHEPTAVRFCVKSFCFYSILNFSEKIQEELEVFKRRAERFGIAMPTIVVAAEEAAKKAKRAERFSAPALTPEEQAKLDARKLKFGSA